MYKFGDAEWTREQILIHKSNIKYYESMLIAEQKKLENMQKKLEELNVDTSSSS